MAALPKSAKKEARKEQDMEDACRRLRVQSLTKEEYDTYIQLVSAAAGMSRQERWSLDDSYHFRIISARHKAEPNKSGQELSELKQKDQDQQEEPCIQDVPADITTTQHAVRFLRHQMRRMTHYEEASRKLPLDDCIAQMELHIQQLKAAQVKCYEQVAEAALDVRTPQSWDINFRDMPTAKETGCPLPSDRVYCLIRSAQDSEGATLRDLLKVLDLSSKVDIGKQRELELFLGNFLPPRERPKLIGSKRSGGAFPVLVYHPEELTLAQHIIEGWIRLHL